MGCGFLFLRDRRISKRARTRSGIRQTAPANGQLADARPTIRFIREGIGVGATIDSGVVVGVWVAEGAGGGVGVLVSVGAGMGVKVGGGVWEGGMMVVGVGVVVADRVGVSVGVAVGIACSPRGWVTAPVAVTKVLGVIATVLVTVAWDAHFAPWLLLGRDGGAARRGRTTPIVMSSPIPAAMSNLLIASRVIETLPSDEESWRNYTMISKLETIMLLYRLPRELQVFFGTFS